MSRTIDSISALIAISSSDLASTHGGAPRTTAQAPQTPIPNAATVPEPIDPTRFKCEPGFNPDYSRITGQLSGNLPVGIGINGAGTYERFQCVKAQ